jgi:hypothetical protein
VKTSPFHKFWPWFFIAAAFESLLALILLLRVPMEGNISWMRLGLAAILFLFFGSSIYFGIRQPARLDDLARTELIIIAALLCTSSGLLLFFLRYLDPEKLLPVYERLSPLLGFFVVLGIQSELFLLLLRNGFNPVEFLKRKAVFLSASIPFLVLLIVYGFVAVTKIGITKDQAYWGEPGVALIGWQTALAILIGVFLLMLSSSLMSERRTRLIIPFAIWLTAVILWLSVPVGVLKNSFYAPITPPSYIPFPYSDAGYYDYLSQSLLIGTDYLGGIPSRPLYVLFLACLHVLLGQDYVKIIAAQTFVLALFPVILYILGKKLHSVSAGVTVALLAIFRELTSLWISSDTRVANSKTLTSDFPTALGIAVVCLISIYWLERRDAKSTFLAGGAIGLLLLLRTQSLIILPVLFILVWLVIQRKMQQWMKLCAAFLLALAVTITPWLIHNYMITGKLAFDDPRQMAVIYSQYSFTNNLDLSSFDIQTINLPQSLVQFTLKNPSFVANFIANHFLNTEIGGLLALPMIERFEGLSAPVNLYWVAWDGSLTWYNRLLVVLYLAVIGIGLSAAWHRLRWIGLVPLAFNLGYSLSNGIARFSSWRYNLPVDWIVYFYFGIGAMEILAGLALLFGAKGMRLFSNQNSPAEFKTLIFCTIPARTFIILIPFLLIGSMPWLATGITANRFTSPSDVLVDQLGEHNHDLAQLESFLSQPKAELKEGRLLYPRFFRRDLGLTGTKPWPVYAPRDFPRQGFLLLNEKNVQAILPTHDPLPFPNGADVIALGCRRDQYFEVRLILFTKSDKIYSSGALSTPCN